MSRSCWCVLLVFALLSLGRPVRAQLVLEEETCREALVHSLRDNIACRAAFRLGPDQRNTLARVSYGLLSDLRCRTDITAKRSELLAQVQPSSTLRLPPQTVYCRLMAQGQPFDVKFRLAPQVRLDQGRAVSAELGVREVNGIPEPAATAVAGFLNSDPGLRKLLVQATNDILQGLPRR